MPKKVKIIFGVLGILAILVALPLTLRLVKERQELRRKAAVPGGTAKLFLVAEKDSTKVGEKLPVTIKVQTPEAPKGITGIKVNLNYTFSPTNPLTLTQQGIEENLASWNYVHKTVTTSGGTTKINIEAVFVQSGETGYLGAIAQAQNFATLNFLAASPGQITLKFDPDPSKNEIRAKEKNLDILGLELVAKTLTVTAAGITPTPTSGATPTPTPTLPPGTTPTPTPTLTPTPTSPPGVTPTPTPTPTLSPGTSPTPTATPTVKTTPTPTLKTAAPTASPPGTLPVSANFTPTLILFFLGLGFFVAAFLFAL